MAKLQERRRELGIEQVELAKQVNTTAPMISYFENYRCLPIPKMLEEICEVLDCDVLDIYEEKELYIKSKTTTRDIRVRDVETRSVYRLTADLPNYAREILSSKNLEKCGYHSLKDFIWHCFKNFERRLKKLQNKKPPSTGNA